MPELSLGGGGGLPMLAVYLRRWRRPILILLVASVVASAGLSSIGLKSSTRVEPTEIIKGPGYQFYITFPAAHFPLANRSDTNDAPQASNVALYQNGTALFGHSLHTDIVEKGGGRYSHWGEYLIFSSIDGSDARNGQNTFTMMYRERLPQPVFVTLFLLLATILPFTITGADITRLSMMVGRLRPVVGSPASRIALKLFGISLFLLLCAYAAAAEPVAREFLAGRITVTVKLLRFVVTITAGFSAALVFGLFAGELARKAPFSALLAAGLLALGAGLPLPLDRRAYFLAGYTFLLAVLAAGLLVGLGMGWRWQGATVWRGAIRAWDRAQENMRPLVQGLVLLTLVLTIPEVFQNWDTSGWMDSNSYDRAAISIANGSQVFGNSFYMPLYQYGMAAIYYVFGHFFFAQQLFNIALGCLSTAIMAVAAWALFRSCGAALLVGLISASSYEMHHAVYYTQIENWYLPCCALVLLWAIRYLQFPGWQRAVVLGIGITLMLNLRSQGGALGAFLCLAPVIAPRLAWRKRIIHGAIIGAVAAAGLVPWALRNQVVEGRFSPASSQSITQLAVLNDPRIAFYGIRYGMNYVELTNEWLARYPDKLERQMAQSAYFKERLMEDPVWFLKAAYWRILSFYGLCPPGVWLEDGPGDTDWASEGRGYMLWAFPAMFALATSFMALLRRRNRATAFLMGGILANLSINLLVGQGEARLSYPSFPFHFMMLPCFLWRPGLCWVVSPAAGRVSLWPRWVNAGTIGLLLLGMAAVHMVAGRHFLYRPLKDARVVLEHSVKIGSEYRPVDAAGISKAQEGDKVRLRAHVLASQLPPPWVVGLAGLPASAQGWAGKRFFYASIEGRPEWIALSFEGAHVNTYPYEGDEIEVGATVQVYDASHVYALAWLQVDSMVLVGSRKDGKFAR